MSIHTLTPILIERSDTIQSKVASGIVFKWINEEQPRRRSRVLEQLCRDILIIIRDRVIMRTGDLQGHA